MKTDLESLQRLIVRLIASPGAEPAGTADSIIVSDRRLDARRRIEIYSTAYFQRLLDVMREDFPATRTVVGDEIFARLVRQYLAAHPPSEPSVFGVGRFLPGFLAAHNEIENFVSDLAALERATIEVFHGPDAAALSADAMRAIAPERWPALVMRTHPALKLLDCRFDVGPALRAFSDGAQWSRPVATPVSIVVWRQGSQVYYRTLEPGERDALGLAMEGAAFAAICAAASEKIEGEPVEAINRMLARWLSDGLLAALS